MGLAVLLKLFTLQAGWVERGYTYGVYPFLSHGMRLLTGWLLFSLGDVLYFAVGIFLIRAVWRGISAMRTDGFKKTAPGFLYTLIRALLVVYLLFNVLWGLNYDRRGIAYQLDLQVSRYDLQDAVQLTVALQARLNAVAAQVDTIKREQLNNTNKLFQKAIAVYSDAALKFPYLQYSHPSIKPSLYSSVGHYFGFTGYYNPFSGEAHIKTSIPVFLKPFVTTHEIAHQLGYAKENEANFVAFLASKQTSDVDVLYSMYYNLYAYAVRDVYGRDTAVAMSFKKSLHPQVTRDNEIFKAYLVSTENGVEPFISRFYDQYLKWNNQKSGVQTYNQVVALLIAYGKKYGWGAI